MLIIFDKRKVIFATAAFLAGTELIALCLLNWQLTKKKSPQTYKTCSNECEEYDNIFIIYRPMLNILIAESADFV